MEQLISIFLTFLYVGTFAFGGGLATLPLLQHAIVDQHGWLSMTEWSDVFTISNMTPGPIAINAATFVGTKLYGVLGAIVATVGIVFTQIVLCTFFAKFLFGEKKSKVLTGALFGLTPGVVGLIASISLSMFFTNLFPQEAEAGATALVAVFSRHLDLMAVIPFFGGLVLLKKKVDMGKILLFGACFGVLLELAL